MKERLKTYYQEEKETMSPETIRKMQDKKLIQTVHHAYANNAYYRQRMEEAHITPDDIHGIADLPKLPFLSKEDLRASYPTGMLSVPLRDCVRIQSTSGTTGKRVIAYYTKEDLSMWAECCARAIVAAGGTKEDILQDCYGYGLFTGGAGLHMGSEKLGCLTLPMSSGNTERQIQFMLDLRSTILACTPSYAMYLAEGLKERNISPADIPLKAGIFGGEPWSENMRASIEKGLGIKAYDIYGLTEITGPGVAFECEAQQGMHINEDRFICEIIDPETGEVLPEGAKGELVFTSLDKAAFPMLRYRTKDICILDRTPCSCGRTFVRMKKPMGRSDDMLIIRGVNVFPSQIEAVLLKEGFTSNYQIVIDRENNSDTFNVYVEYAPEDFDDMIRHITTKEKRLKDALKNEIGVSPNVHLTEPKSMIRSEGKAVRVIDKRVY